MIRKSVFKVECICLKCYQSLATLIEDASLLLHKYKESAGASWGDYTSILLKCAEVLGLIKSMYLPLVKSRWAEFTDAGVNNIEVSFREAEVVRIYLSDIAFGFIGLLAIVDRTRRKGQIQQQGMLLSLQSTGNITNGLADFQRTKYHPRVFRNMKKWQRNECDNIIVFQY